jgi:hypothetical protein
MIHKQPTKYTSMFMKYFIQHVSVAIAAIFKVMLLSQEHKGTNVVSCIAVTPYKLKFITISVKIL